MVRIARVGLDSRPSTSKQEKSTTDFILYGPFSLVGYDVLWLLPPDPLRGPPPNSIRRSYL